MENQTRELLTQKVVRVLGSCTDDTWVATQQYLELYLDATGRNTAEEDMLNHVLYEAITLAPHEVDNRTLGQKQHDIRSVRKPHKKFGR